MEHIFITLFEKEIDITSLMGAVNRDDLSPADMENLYTILRALNMSARLVTLPYKVTAK